MVRAQWRRPICAVLPIAPDTYYEHLARRADPARLSDRAQRDTELRPHIQRVFDANWQVYGVRKVWRQLRREGFDVARCTVARLMKAMGIQGVIRGKPQRTTIPDKKLPCPPDKVNRQFRVPAQNMIWVSDFTYVATWKGFVYVAFVIDAYARKIVGWRVSTSPHAGFVLDAIEQAVHDCRAVKAMGPDPNQNQPPESPARVRYAKTASCFAARVSVRYCRDSRIWRWLPVLTESKIV